MRQEVKGGNGQRVRQFLICAETVTKSVSMAASAIILAASAIVQLGSKARVVKMKSRRSRAATD